MSAYIDAQDIELSRSPDSHEKAVEIFNKIQADDSFRPVHDGTGEAINEKRLCPDYKQLDMEIRNQLIPEEVAKQERINDAWWWTLLSHRIAWCDKKPAIETYKTWLRPDGSMGTALIYTAYTLGVLLDDGPRSFSNSARNKLIEQFGGLDAISEYGMYNYGERWVQLIRGEITPEEAAAKDEEERKWFSAWMNGDFVHDGN